MLELLKGGGVEEKDVCIVRIKTSYWKDDKGIHYKKDINWLKRRCVGYNILREDAANLDVDQIVDSIENLHSVKDGIYKVVTTNEVRDYWTGYIEEYGYKLIKVEGESYD